ncbi:PQQ-binding-like beta-propeller repeat protein [bacterium]|nr:PQQ-binding-like beta-propeller repeat protein [bacterium]
MKHADRLRIFMTLSLILICMTFNFAQDWPQWRGPNRDGKVTGFTAPQIWPNALKQGWTVTVGTGDATPALVGERLYVFTRQGDEEITRCLDAASGKELWQDKVKAETVTGPASRHPGPRSSPAVADGKVVILGVGNVLSCLDAATGKVLWRKNDYSGIVPEFFSGMSPIVVDGMAIAHLGDSNGGAIIAYDLNTGNQKWKLEGDGPSYASPVLITVGNTKQIVTQTAQNILGIAVADGKLLWKVQTTPVQRFYNSATPIIDGEIVIYTGQGKGTRALQVQKQGDSYVTSELWSNPDVGTGYNTPVLKDGMLYGISDRGNLYCMNAETGEMTWMDDVRYSGNFGAIVDAGSVLLALPTTAELVVYEPNGQKYNELAKIKVAETETYAHPVIAGNRIYIKDQNTLKLLTVQ